MKTSAPASAAPGSALRSAVRAAFWTLVALALPACLLTTAAYFSSRPALLAQLSPFRVQYAALLAGLVAFCLVLRHRRWAACFAAFAVFNLWAVTRSALPPPASAHETAHPPLKILLANILSSNPDPAPLLALVAAENPDLVALLEVNERWSNQLLAALAADYPFQHRHPREDNFGLAVFSRHPLGEDRDEVFVDPELPSYAFGVSLAGRPLRVLLTHPLPPGSDAGARLRDEQLARIGDWVRSQRDVAPVLLLGDFNATVWCPPLRRLLAEADLRPAAAGHRLYPGTWPASVPFLRIPIDHVLLDERLVCTAYRVGPDVGSDHFPVLLEIHPRR